MARFIWAGQIFSSEVDPTAPSIPRGAFLYDIQTKSDRLKCHWNNPANWREIVPGVGQDVYKEVDVCPGGDDHVYFKPFTIGEQSYPKSPCLFGGYWGDEGWLNASNTGGKLSSFNVDEFWGVPVGDEATLSETNDYYESITEPTSENPWTSEGLINATYRIGLFEPERDVAATLSSDELGYNFEGIKLTGLRINAKNITSRIGESRAHCLNLTDPNTFMCLYNDGGYVWHNIFGGTVNQLLVQGLDCPSDSRNPAKKTNANIRFNMTHDDKHGPTGSVVRFRSNVTGYAYIGELTNSYEKAWGDANNSPWVWLDSDSRPTSVMIDQSIRPSLNAYNLGCEYMYIYPEYGRRDVRSIEDYGFQGIRIGYPSGYQTTGATPDNYCHIGTLNMVDHPTDPNRKVIPLGGFDEFKEEAAYLALNDIKLCGANNIVSWEGEGVIDNININGGRFCLGRRYRWMKKPGAPGTPREESFCSLSPGEVVELTSGTIFNNSILDARHPNDPLYRDLIIGNGASLPDESVGLQFGSPEAIVLYPQDSRVVMGFETSSNDGQGDDDGTIETFPGIPAVITQPPRVGDILGF